jgi:hypothetical protein
MISTTHPFKRPSPLLLRLRLKLLEPVAMLGGLQLLLLLLHRGTLLLLARRAAKAFSAMRLGAPRAPLRSALRLHLLQHQRPSPLQDQIE